MTLVTRVMGATERPDSAWAYLNEAATATGFDDFASAPIGVLPAVTGRDIRCSTGCCHCRQCTSRPAGGGVCTLGWA
ncbi:hypothetical protein ACFWN7_04290 [Agromyces sp. NPDC058484]|uniref:hypothetical protein n=1 Tax=Agromyces sp. NPDC058484 TaxID=3346524 RepID=UPI003663ED3C